MSENSFPPDARPTLRYIWLSFGQRSPLRLPHSGQISPKLWRASEGKQFSVFTFSACFLSRFSSSIFSCLSLRSLFFSLTSSNNFLLHWFLDLLQIRRKYWWVRCQIQNFGCEIFFIAVFLENEDILQEIGKHME